MLKQQRLHSSSPVKGFDPNGDFIIHPPPSVKGPCAQTAVFTARFSKRIFRFAALVSRVNELDPARDAQIARDCGASGSVELLALL